MDETSSFHAGERAVQARAGEADMAAHNSGMLARRAGASAAAFIAGQFMVVLGSVDGEGRLWASLLFGDPGFLQVDQGSAILIDVPETERDPSDPVWANLAANPALGMLFIELGSRRRFRVNGTVRRLDQRGAEVTIQQAYPNCPRYIQRRRLRRRGKLALPVQAAHGTVLRGSVEDIVRRADTIFVASYAAGSGADVSHRGGNPRFVEVLDESTLRIPDYPGNGLFNTLGNFAVDPHAGLCILDFEHGQLLQLTGAASLRWDQDDPGYRTGGTGRYWEFKLERWILRDSPQPLEWDYLDASPFNPGEGRA